MTPGTADVLWRTLNLGGAHCTKTPRNGIPGYPTPTHPSNRNSPRSSVLLFPSSFTSAFSHYHPLPPPPPPPRLSASRPQLGSAADRSPGFSLLGQNGGEGLSLNEESTDYMSGSASMIGIRTRFCWYNSSCSNLTLWGYLSLFPHKRAQPWAQERG